MSQASLKLQGLISALALLHTGNMKRPAGRQAAQGTHSIVLEACPLLLDGQHGQCQGVWRKPWPTWQITATVLSKRHTFLDPLMLQLGDALCASLVVARQARPDAHQLVGKLLRRSAFALGLNDGLG